MRRVPNPTGKGGNRFPKGVSGNPGGKKKIAPEIKAFQETTYKDFIAKLQIFGTWPSADLIKLIDDPQTIVFDKIFARILVDAGEGKSDARQVLIERLWGKVKEMEATTAFAAEQEMMKRIPISELVELAKKYRNAQ